MSILMPFGCVCVGSCLRYLNSGWRYLIRLRLCGPIMPVISSSMGPVFLMAAVQVNAYAHDPSLGLLGSGPRLRADVPNGGVWVPIVCKHPIKYFHISWVSIRA